MTKTTRSKTISKTIRRSLSREEQLDRAMGLRLRNLRTDAGLAIDDFARRAGFNPAEISDHEEGLIPIPLARLHRYAKALGRTPEQLMTELLKGSGRSRAKPTTGAGRP